LKTQHLFRTKFTHAQRNDRSPPRNCLFYGIKTLAQKLLRAKQA
jgi:hypothetical protein